MKSIRTHLSVILPLVFLLFSVQFMFFLQNILKDYSQIMRNDFNIIIVSKKDLSGEADIRNIKSISSIEPIDSNESFKKFEGKISKQTFEKLQSSMPKFYRVKLEFFPNSKELMEIAEKIRVVDGVSKVEIFSKTHNSIYKNFLLLNNIVLVFVFLVTVLSVFLVFKQIKIWLFEHQKRIEIMELFGASLFFKSSILFKLAIIDSIISVFIVIAFYISLPHFSLFNNLLNELSLNTNPISIKNDIWILFAIAFLITLFAVLIVTLFSKDKK